MTQNLLPPAHTEIADIEALLQQSTSFFADRCWADTISAIGGVAGVLGAREVIKGRYGRAAVYAIGSALADFGDGLEARRFARRNPEAAAMRKNEGGWKDQIWDRIRNISLGSSILTIKEVPPAAKVVVSAMVAKETVTGVIGVETLADHYIQEKEGWPAPLPSADRGKESMWWVGAGLAGIMLGAKLKRTSPELAQKVTNTSGGLVGIGLLRGLQTVPEYLRVQEEMAVLTPEQQTNYEPNYKPHIVSRVRQIAAFALENVK